METRKPTKQPKSSRTRQLHNQIKPNVTEADGQYKQQANWNLKSHSRRGNGRTGRRPKSKPKSTSQHAPEELDDAETTHFLQTMFDERPATEVRYDQMIVDIRVQQAMHAQVLPRKAAMRRSKRYQSEATQQLYIRRERERCKDARAKTAGQCDSAMLN